MKLTDIFNDGKLHISFEVFPPKNETAFENVKKATEDIAALSPSFVSVTYGAGGGTSKFTLDIAKNIKDTYNIPVLVHFTCVSSTREIVLNQLKNISSYGLENIMALRGDLTPELIEKGCGDLDYKHATDLIKEIKQSGIDCCIGGACYPEIHPESKTLDEDLDNLKLKIEAGCQFLTTQMFFDNNLFFNYMYKLREKGIIAPIIPGIMPITNSKQVERAVKISGAFMPQRFKSLVDKFGDNPDAMKQAGIAYATDQIIDLYANGIKNIHIYSMNKPDVAAKILDNLSYIIN